MSDGKIHIVGEKASQRLLNASPDIRLGHCPIYSRILLPSLPSSPSSAFFYLLLSYNVSILALRSQLMKS